MDEPTWPPERRSDDGRIARLETRFGELEKKLDENTTATRQVLDLIRALNLLVTLAKWASVGAGAAVGVYHAIAAYLKTKG